MKVPQAWSPAPASVTASTKVTARINMSAEVAGAGLCPDCQQPMIPMVAANVETLTCMPCRISLPVANATEQAEEGVPTNPEEIVQEAPVQRASVTNLF